jgi:hypothetical protein
VLNKCVVIANCYPFASDQQQQMCRKNQYFRQSLRFSAFSHLFNLLAFPIQTIYQLSDNQNMEGQENLLESEMETDETPINNNAIVQPQQVPDAAHHQIQQQEDQDAVAVVQDVEQEDQDAVAVVQQDVELNNNIVEPQVQQHVEQHAVADLQQQMVALNIPAAELASMMENQRSNDCMEEMRRRENNLPPDMDAVQTFDGTPMHLIDNYEHNLSLSFRGSFICFIISFNEFLFEF